MPSTLAGKSSNVPIRFNGGSVQTGVQLLSAEPGIFVQGGSTSGQALAINQDNLFNSPVNLAARGSILTFWATGQGATSPLFIDGQSAPATPLWQPVLPVAVTIGAQTGDVVAALAPGFAGLLQSPGERPHPLSDPRRPRDAHPERRRCYPQFVRHSLFRLAIGHHYCEIACTAAWPSALTKNGLVYLFL